MDKFVDLQIPLEPLADENLLIRHEGKQLTFDTFIFLNVPDASIYYVKNVYLQVSKQVVDAKKR